ncbi:C40 family peptidase [Lactobacillus equicursoris]|uniref:C40 family peptidase n=1 Tax=Lactobacillus equicursoris TaxID=420645 RepID=UPI0039920962
MKFKKSLVKVLAAFAVAFAGFVTVNTVSSNQVQASTTTTKRNKVVSLAKKQVGKRYVYGATGPSSFDCSGLTSYVYSHAIGKYITRTTYTQVKKGKTVAVSTSRLKKGDLLFWGSKSSPYHVGIYIGGGQYVHAATPSQGVRKQYLSSYFWPSTAKRVI